MKHTLYDEAIKRNSAQIFADYPILFPIIERIHAAGGRALLVGGAVRDIVLNRPLKDCDIEIHRISLDALQDILSKHGRVDVVGKSFGVLRIAGIAIDWSLPRTDKAGRHPEVSIDPYMDIKDAFARRDLTMNAMGIDLYTHELIDPFGGIDDMQNKVLRTPDPVFFVQDPLRFFRVMQFIGRFDMMPDKQLDAVCRSMDISSVSRERIEMECDKLFLQSRAPSRGLRWIVHLGRLHEIMPELSVLETVVQEVSWHPEGDVLEHSLQALDAAAIIGQNYPDDQTKLVLMWAALCHDLGKAETTKLIKGRWTSHGHAQKGVPIAKKLMGRITHKKDLISAVCKLVYYHMVPAQFVLYKTRLSRYKRLALKLMPDATLALLADLVRADQRGRNGKGPEPLSQDKGDMDIFVAQARHAGVLEGVEPPLLLGADLMDIVPPGPALGALLKKAYAIQLERGIVDKEELKRFVLKL
jgi:tRNA nucleotidyltransferase (CCA-adding enzyme)